MGNLCVKTTMADAVVTARHTTRQMLLENFCKYKFATNDSKLYNVKKAINWIQQIERELKEVFIPGGSSNNDGALQLCTNGTSLTHIKSTDMATAKLVLDHYKKKADDETKSTGNQVEPKSPAAPMPTKKWNESIPATKPLSGSKKPSETPPPTLLVQPSPIPSSALPMAPISSPSTTGQWKNYLTPSVREPIAQPLPKSTSNSTPPSTIPSIFSRRSRSTSMTFSPKPANSNPWESSSPPQFAALCLQPPMDVQKTKEIK